MTRSVEAQCHLVRAGDGSTEAQCHVVRAKMGLTEAECRLVRARSDVGEPRYDLVTTRLDLPLYRIRLSTISKVTFSSQPIGETFRLKIAAVNTAGESVAGPEAEIVMT